MNLFVVFFCLLLLCAGVLGETCLPFQFSRRSPHSISHVERLSPSVSSPKPPPFKEATFDQRVDHFGFHPTTPATYPMRYLLCDAYWDKKETSPVLFYTGNEGDITLFYANTGFIFELAEKLNALVVFAEHRYYGKSLPDASLGWEYLTTEQALADYAVFLEWLLPVKLSIPDAPVIAIGGSYGGMLSAWFRMKYPNIVAGALSASGPVAQFEGWTSQYAFNEIVSKDYDEDIQPILRKGFDALYSQPLSIVSKSLRVCNPLKDTKDIDALYHFLYNALSYMTMINYPYPTSFLQPVPAWPVDETCKRIRKIPEIETSTLATLEALRVVVDVYFNSSGTLSCFNISQDSASDLGDEAWDYQSCTEMPFPMGANGKTDVLRPRPYDFGEFTECCLKKFGVKPNPTWIPTQFGARDVSGASNIFFSNGNLDPWSSGGVLSVDEPSLQAFVIDKGAHHLDLRFSDEADPKSVQEARALEYAAILLWIGEHNNNSNKRM